MKAFIQKKKLTLFLLLSALVLLALIFLYQKSETVFIKVTAHLCHKESINEQRKCFEDKILVRTESNPRSTKPLFDTIWKMGSEGSLSYDMRLFSPIIHDVGMQLVEKNISLEEALSLCSLSFRGGCIHGVIMEYLDNNGKDFSSWNQTICKPFKHNIVIYKNCFHALGHEFTAKSKEPLRNILLLCNSVPELYKNDCVYGAFMEFSKGETGTGRHLETPVGKRDPPCDEVTDEFKSNCYISVGFYGQYEADSEQLQTTYTKCLTLPHRWRDYCLQGISASLLFSQGMNKERAINTCESLPKKMRGICLQSF